MLHDYTTCIVDSCAKKPTTFQGNNKDVGNIAIGPEYKFSGSKNHSKFKMDKPYNPNQQEVTTEDVRISYLSATLRLGVRNLQGENEMR